MQILPLAHLALMGLVTFSQSAWAQTTYSTAALNIHNGLRSRHQSTPNLAWNTTLATYASNWVSQCKFAYSGGPYAELVGASYDSNLTAIINNWYTTEQPKYNYASPGFNSSTGHFTQIVWASTTQLGCASKQCNGIWYHFCEYSPPGNIVGATSFSTNVRPLKVAATSSTSGGFATSTTRPATSSTSSPTTSSTRPPTVGTPTSSVATAPTTSTPPPSSTSSASAPLSSLAVEAVNAHNAVRAKHQNTPPMTWNQTLADFGQNYLNNNNCAFQHSGGPYGENLAAGYNSVTASVNAWYAEISQYNYSAPGFSSATGHFTQVVWKGSTQVGCATRSCPTWIITICEYYPRGNIVGGTYFRDNVLPLK